MNSDSYVRSRPRISLMAYTMLFFAIATASIFLSDTVHAATNDPDSKGVYRFLEIARDNDFRVYAKPGETIHVTIFKGVSLETNYPNNRLCQVIRMLVHSGAPVTGQLRISGVRDDDGSTFGLGKGKTVMTRDPTDSDQVTTCSSSDEKEAFRELTISYTVPSGYNITSMEEAFIVRFLKDTNYKDDKADGGMRAQGYEWRIAVNTNRDFVNDDTKPSSISIPGRTWFVGDDSGLDIWQRNSQKALTSNSTNHVFKYVRTDGYRYAVRYGNYHGIWSTFHGGVYGVRNKTTNIPAYMSYGTDTNPSYKFLLPSGAQNLAYVFVDCPWGETSIPCPNIPFLRSQPVTSDNGGLGNPLAEATDSATASTGFRYTNYSPSTNLAGGTVTIPYKHMQTGYIRLTVEKGSTLLCQRDYLIDDPDGEGIAGTYPDGNNTETWKFQQDKSCSSSGTLTTSNVTTIPTNEILTITAQAYHLGEMHFIDVDTEQRGSIEVRGNGRGSPVQQQSIIWYDPFSRSGSHTCGAIPGRVADGGLSHTTTTWDSMSSGRDSILGILPKLLADGASGSVDRLAVNSSGGVHGWVSASDCDGSGTGGTNGHAKNDGTASSYSTWGNDRVIEDWTYAFDNPAPRIIAIGGPVYTLTPSATAVPNAVSTGEQTIFTTTVSNNSTNTSKLTDWAIRKIIIPPTITTGSGWDDRTGTDATQFGCSYYTSLGTGVTCSPVDSGTDKTFGANSTPVGAGSYNEILNYPLGTRVCYAVMVNSYTQGAKPNYRERVGCAIIAKYPALEVQNGNVRAGGAFVSATGTCGLPRAVTSASNPYGVLMHAYSGSAIRGSYGWYAATTPGLISQYGSMSTRYSDTALSNKKKLLFGSGGLTASYTYGPEENGYFLARIPTSLTAGYDSYCLPDVTKIYHSSTTPTVVSVSGVGTQVPLATANGKTYNFGNNSNSLLRINGATVASGGNIVIRITQDSTSNVNNDVYITSSIEAAGGATSYTSIAQLPRVIVLADKPIDIHFEAAVTKIYGTYSTKGNIYTCDDYDGSASKPLTATICNQQLTVNGALIAQGRVLPFRTAGYDTNVDTTPAEIFNLGAETILSDYSRALQQPILTTKYQYELPSRL